jgi:hypothetical protein
MLNHPRTASNLALVAIQVQQPPAADAESTSGVARSPR